MAFIKINRKLFKNWIWTDNEPFSKRGAWIDLLQRANFSNQDQKVIIKGTVVKIPRGSLVCSLRNLMNDWNWKSLGRVKRFLNLLEREGMIEFKTERYSTLVNICNYRHYNPVFDSNGTQTERSRIENEQDLSIDRPKNGTQTERRNFTQEPVISVVSSDSETAECLETERKRNANGTQTEQL